MYYVYVIRSLRENMFYKGQTNNLERRLEEHEIDRWGPYELIFVQISETRSEAMLMEKYLKTGNGREFINLIVG
jgi:putative endonuclease